MGKHGAGLLSPVLHCAGWKEVRVGAAVRVVMVMARRGGDTLITYNPTLVIQEVLCCDAKSKRCPPSTLTPLRSLPPISSLSSSTHPFSLPLPPPFSSLPSPPSLHITNLAICSSPRPPKRP